MVYWKYAFHITIRVSRDLSYSRLGIGGLGSGSGIPLRTCSSRYVSPYRSKIFPSPTILTRKLEFRIGEPETLLIDFLSELIYLTESERIAFDQFNLEISGDLLIAQLSGSRIESVAKEIKAATYHNLEIRETRDGLVANIVFDV